MGIGASRFAIVSALLEAMSNALAGMGLSSLTQNLSPVPLGIHVPLFEGFGTPYNAEAPVR